MLTIGNALARVEARLRKFTRGHAFPLTRALSVIGIGAILLSCAKQSAQACTAMNGVGLPILFDGLNEKGLPPAAAARPVFAVRVPT